MTLLCLKRSRGLNHKLEQEAFEQQKKSDLRITDLVNRVDSLGRELNKAQVENVWHLSYAANYKDNATGHHLWRMSAYSTLLAELINLDSREVELISKSSPLHDIGKIGIPGEILSKPGPLTPDERLVMEKHTLIGGSILGTGNSDYMNTGTLIALTHHERWDGKGYPYGLKEDDIPIAGRICAVADSFDALTSKRPYKAAYPVDRAVDIIISGRETCFDPGLVDIFVSNLESMLDIKDNLLEDPYEGLVVCCEQP
ncbi:HD domain-containing protein [Pseudodesulfovibrio sp.]|nr:HD domain-containing protein [Pseudodesulfovibrio sp.]